ncbi:hypothetical protein PPROV_000155700 [Pycnococcus provasolii]|uniref:SET domain-containing protein n=1 Tax=Pycnococcus provasolii TaxID=41880 RepID=A0A830H893_9CHLO|nr:hypothetical protein PPROV_000155700 [Pycnococcus provasolii]
MAHDDHDDVAGVVNDAPALSPSRPPCMPMPPTYSAAVPPSAISAREEPSLLEEELVEPVVVVPGCDELVGGELGEDFVGNPSSIPVALGGAPHPPPRGDVAMMELNGNEDDDVPLEENENQNQHLRHHDGGAPMVLDAAMYSPPAGRAPSGEAWNAISAVAPAQPPRPLCPMCKIRHCEIRGQNEKWRTTCSACRKSSATKKQEMTRRDDQVQEEEEVDVEKWVDEVLGRDNKPDEATTTTNDEPARQKRAAGALPSPPPPPPALPLPPPPPPQSKYYGVYKSSDCGTTKYFSFKLKGKAYTAHPASTDAVSGDATALAYIRDHAIRHFGSTSALNYPQVEQLPEQYTAAGAELLEQLRRKIEKQPEHLDDESPALDRPNAPPPPPALPLPPPPPPQSKYYGVYKSSDCGNKMYFYFRLKGKAYYAHPASTDAVSGDATALAYIRDHAIRHFGSTSALNYPQVEQLPEQYTAAGAELLEQLRRKIEKQPEHLDDESPALGRPNGVPPVASLETPTPTPGRTGDDEAPATMTVDPVDASKRVLPIGVYKSGTKSASTDATSGDATALAYIRDHAIRHFGSASALNYPQVKQLPEQYTAAAAELLEQLRRKIEKQPEHLDDESPALGRPNGVPPVASLETPTPTPTPGRTGDDEVPSTIPATMTVDPVDASERVLYKSIGGTIGVYNSGTKLYFYFRLKGKVYYAHPASTDAVSGDATALAYIRDHAIRHFGSASALNYPQVKQLPEQYAAAGAELLEQLRRKIEKQPEHLDDESPALDRPNGVPPVASLETPTPTPTPGRTGDDEAPATMTVDPVDASMLREDSSQKEPWRRDAAKFALENAIDVETAQGCKAAEAGDRVQMAAECASGEARNHIHNPEPNPYPTGSTKQAAYEVLFRATPEERQAGLPLEEFVRRIRTMLKVDENMWPANTKTPDGTLHAAMAGDSCFLKTIKRTFTLSGSAPSKIAGYGNRVQQLPMEQTYEDDRYATMMSRRDTAKSKDEKTLLTYEEMIEREFEQKRKIAEANRSNVAAKKQKTSHVVVEDEVLDCSVDSLERPDEIPPNPFLAIKKPDAYAFPLPPPPLSSPSPSLPPPPPLPSSSFPPPPPLPPTTPPDRIQNSLQSVQIATRMKAIAYEVLANATSGERETGLTITEIMQRSIHVSESLGEDVEFAFSTTVTLAILIAAGALTPGVDKLSCKCFDNTHNAELLQDGRIRYMEMTFDSPSAFSVYCKRIYNPTRRADDGWGSVTYDGVTLKDIKTKAMESMKDKDALSKEKLLESLNSDNCFAKKASGRFTLSYSVREERDTRPWSGPIPQSSRSKRLPISKERCSGFADFVAFITSAADDVLDSTENDCSKELPRGVHRRAGRSKMFFQFSLKGKAYNAYPASTDAVWGDATALAYIRDHAIRHFGSTSVLNYPQVEQLPEQYTAAAAELLEQLRCKIGPKSKQVNNAEAASTAPNQAQCTASGARVVERSPHDPPASWWKTRSKDKGVATSFLGWRVVKRFNGKSYHGTIDGFDEDEAWYHVTFDDNDQEEVDLNEILSISKRRYFLSKQIPVLCQLDDDNILTEKVLGCTFSHRAAALFKRRRKWSLRQREISAVRITSQVPHAQDLRNVRDAVMAYLVSLGVDVGVSLAYGVPINFPREAPSHRSVEQYTVDSSDARVSLRGEFGCRATDIIPANTVIGVYTGHCFFNDEMFAMIEMMIAPTDGVSRLKAERDVESGIQEFTRFNRQSKRFDGPAAGKGELLMVSSFGDDQGVCGRINDALVDVYDSNELVDDGYNVICVEAELQGWPFLFVCTTRDVRAGSDLRMDYTGYYWERIGEMKRRLDFVQL